MTPFGAYVQVMATERCNLACRHCAVPEEDSPATGELTTDEWIAFITLLGSEGVAALTLSGGEVTLRRDAVALLRAALTAQIPRVTLLTNGLLREQTIKDLAALQRAHPNLGVHVSLDGASPQTHDLIRGRGTFTATLRRIARFRSQGGRVSGMHSVLHRANLHEFDAMATLVRELGCDVWTVFPVAALGRAAGSDLQPLSAAQWSAVTVRLEALRSDGLDVGQMGPIVEDEWPSSLGVVPRGRDDLSPNVVVGPDGAMFTCPPLRGRPIGWVSGTDSHERWQDARAIGSGITAQACPRCKFRLLCTGIHPTRPFVSGTAAHLDPALILAGHEAPGNG